MAIERAQFGQVKADPEKTLQNRGYMLKVTWSYTMNNENLFHIWKLIPKKRNGQYFFSKAQLHIVTGVKLLRIIGSGPFK
jgi:hypothetical protein